MQKYKILINGEMRSSEEWMPIYSPIDGTAAGEVPVFPLAEMVEEAYQSAEKAFNSWKKTPFNERKAKLLDFANHLEQNTDTLAKIMLREIAKSMKDCQTEIKRTVDYIRQTVLVYEQELLQPEIIGANETKIANKTGKFYREAIGVILAVSPFNYPVNLLISKVAAALITGNTVVYKGATQGTLSAAFISQLLFETNFPAGVINCVVGSGKALGDLLFSNPIPKMIAFTGGTRVGKMLMTKHGDKKLLLELGGKDPALVLDDADLELTSKEIINGAFNYNGQRCTAIKRVFVSSKLHKPLLEKLNEKLKTLSIGQPADNPVITPLISERAVDYLMELIQEAELNGAELQQPVIVEGTLFHPVIMDNVTPEMRLAWEEPFGPVLPIIVYENVAEAIKMINASEYGLQASVFTSNIEYGEQLAMEIEAGTVNINRSSSRGPDIFPFSGVKESGVGVQGIRDAMLEMTHIKGIIINK